MPMRIVFWILMLLWLVLGIIPVFQREFNFVVFGGAVLPFILFFLLGWKSFGPAVSE